eukprot:10115998-Karenia_brevis.AAC.1
MVSKLGQQLSDSFGGVCAWYPTALTTPVLFACPYGHTRSAGWPFHHLDVHKAVYCTTCSRSFGGAQWACPCDYIWHSCSLHFVATSDSTQPVRVKRARTFHTAAQSNQKLARLEPNVATKFCLGPKLSAKFPHLAQQTDQSSCTTF